MEFDDDDLYEDMIQDEDDGPPPDITEYEEVMFDEMMSSNSGDVVAAVAAAAPAQSSAARDEEAPPSPSFDDTPIGDYDDEDSVDVRAQFAAGRDGAASDPFSFERYRSSTSWRSKDGSKSPRDEMKAKEWKSHQFAATHSDTFATSRRAQAPDVQLMEFGRTAPRCIAVRSFRYKYGRPIAGAKVVSMTLSEGMRVYFPVENSTTQQKPQQSESQIQKSVLGISIEALLRRVNTMRRQKEHEKTQELRNYEEEEGELQQEGEERRSSDNNMLWVDKHAPTTFSHLLSDERTNREVLRAVRAWDPYVFHKEPPPRPQMKYASKQETQVVQSPTEKATRIKKDKDRRPDENSRVILLAGPCGCGKTTLANIISRHAGYRPIQINGSDDRSANILTEHLVRAMESSTLNFAGSDSGKSRPNCIIMDEIDGADAKEIKALVDIIQADVPGKGAKRTQFLRRPIIFICNNKWAPALRPLLPFAKQFDVSPPSSVRLVSRLQAVLKHEGLTVSGGSSMLNNLVTLSSGDIRSCLYTLQFVAYRARELSARQKRIIGDNEDIGQSSTVDIGEALTESLGGNGLKDERRDAAGTLAVVFRKEKTKDSTDQSRSIDRVLKSVTTFDDNSRMLDSLFLNVARVSYIDPAFDRCSLAHEWLSICDTFRSEKSSNNTGAMMSVQNHHIPTAAAALHLLCRVEQRPDLVFSIREFFDNRFQMENNQSLVQRFAEGNLPSSRCSRSIHLMVMETIPYALWILSSGHGTSALERSTASLELLNKNELTSFQRHANLLYTLGLTYITAESAPTNSYKNAQRQTSVRMEPPITRLVSYAGWDQSNVMKRRQIPPGLKLLLAQRASQERNSEIPGDDSDQLTKQDAPNADLISTKRKPDAVSLILPVTKKTKAPSPNSVATSHNFLLIGARKALEAKSARTAARVGYDRSKKDKKAHTGSGVPLPHVLRLKFVKGYTEAVRTPCYLKDLV